jgi:hypothetical protein
MHEVFASLEEGENDGAISANRQTRNSLVGEIYSNGFATTAHYIIMQGRELKFQRFFFLSFLFPSTIL